MRESIWKVMEIVEAEDDKVGFSGGSEKWWDAGYFFKNYRSEKKKTNLG